MRPLPTPTLVPHRVVWVGTCGNRGLRAYEHESTRIGLTDMSLQSPDWFPVRRLAEDLAAVAVCDGCGGDRERLTLGRGTPYIDCGAVIGVEDGVRSMAFFRVESKR